MQRLFDLVWIKNIDVPKDIETHQYLFDLLNVLTAKLLDISIPPHRNSRLSKCRCALCRYQQLCELLTHTNFPEELALPRRTPNFALKFIPINIKSLNVSHSLITQLLLPPNFNKLESLNVTATSLVTNCINQIALLPNLKILNVSECNVKDAILLQIKDVPLEVLICTNNLLTNTTLTQLQNTPLGNNLKYFDISNNQIKPSILPSLLKYPQLNILILKGTQVDQRSLKAFVSRHENYKYNGMQIEKVGQKFNQQQYSCVNDDWGINHFTEALCILGCVSFKQEQTKAKTSAESIVFTNPN